MHKKPFWAFLDTFIFFPYDFLDFLGEKIKKSQNESEIIFHIMCGVGWGGVGGFNQYRLPVNLNIVVHEEKLLSFLYKEELIFWENNTGLLKTRPNGLMMW